MINAIALAAALRHADAVWARLGDEGRRAYLPLNAFWAIWGGLHVRLDVDGGRQHGRKALPASIGGR